MVATIWMAAVFPSLPLQLVTLAGAVAMVLAGCPKPLRPGNGIDDDALRGASHEYNLPGSPILWRWLR